MSDLQLLTRRTLFAVKKGYRLGTEVMQDAQDALGVSNELLSRELNVSEKTWRRWKKIGEVPIYHLPTVAEVLNLEIERPSRRKVAGPGEAGDGIAEKLAEVLVRLDRIEQAVLRGAPAVPRQRRAAR